MNAKIIISIMGNNGMKIGQHTVSTRYARESIGYVNAHAVESKERKRDPATKNLESLMRSINKAGYYFSIDQYVSTCQKCIRWSAFLHEFKTGKVAAYVVDHPTAFIALKEAMKIVEKN